jgi:hypothetical protein
MSHLDESTVHAYLDGEEGRTEMREKNIERHLAACAQCREAVEAASLLRDRAGEILALADPGPVTAPPLSELERRAEARGAPRTGLRMTPLAVAASLALAVVAGWAARGLLTSTDIPADQAVPADEAVLADESPAPPTTELIRAAAPSTGDTGAPADATQQTAGLGGGARDVAQAPVEEETGGPPTVTPVVEPPEPVTMVADPAPTRDESLRLRAAEPADIPAAREMAAPEVQLESVVVTGAPAAEIWTPVSADEARWYLNTDLVTIPELPVAAYGTGIRNGERAVRVVQTLQGTDSVELILTRVSADAQNRAAAAPQAGVMPLRPDTARGPIASIRRGELLVTARGTVGADSLRALLALIEGQ